MNSRHFLHDLPVLPLDAAEIIARTMARDRRVLLFGPMGMGKSTLMTALARHLADRQRDCWCINADPGSPVFGVPGALSIASLLPSGWQVSKLAALCTLDAGRFRLPLVTALHALVEDLPSGILLIDSPGVVRGVAGRELLQGLLTAANVDMVLALTNVERTPPMLDELRALPAEVYLIPAASEAKRPGKRTRARQRTVQWNSYLANAIEQTVDLSTMNIAGTPPPVEEPHAWVGRQVAMLQRTHTLVLAEVRRLKDNMLTVAIAAQYSDDADHADTLLIRDASRNTEGLLETSAPYAPERFTYLPPADVLSMVEISGGPRVAGRIGGVDVALVNGVFGDPLLHMRVRHQRRSLLFDLGEGNRLAARIAHQVTDVFISHAHMDHIGGFLWLMRSRLGEYPACRLYGPPGLAKHIAGFISGVLWDRVADNGPKFTVMEYHGDRLHCYQLQAGYTETTRLADVAVTDGIVVEERGYRIRAAQLDHQGVPVLAYAFEPDKQVNVRKDQLKACGLEAGPWLNDLKQQVISDNYNAMIQLPDGKQETAGALTERLLFITPGKKIVYATDLADTADNRQQLTHLAQHAHTLFCEASFIEADVDHAIRNGHLTTRACGEIAATAGVARLVPFHFSRRYTGNPQQLYEEINMYCGRVVLPQAMELFSSQ